MKKRLALFVTFLAATFLIGATSWAVDPVKTAPAPKVTPKTVIATTRVPGPDLVVSNISDPPASGSPGGQFVVTDTTRNTGSAPTSAATYTNYRLSTDLKLGNDVILDGVHTVAAGLAAGANNLGKVTVTIPASTPAGSYYLGACADAPGVVTESNEENNCRFSSTKISVSVKPALQQSVTGTTATVQRAGETLTPTVVAVRPSTSVAAAPPGSPGVDMGKAVNVGEGSAQAERARQQLQERQARTSKDPGKIGLPDGTKDLSTYSQGPGGIDKDSKPTLDAASEKSKTKLDQLTTGIGSRNPNAVNPGIRDQSRPQETSAAGSRMLGQDVVKPGRGEYRHTGDSRLMEGGDTKAQEPPKKDKTPEEIAAEKKAAEEKAKKDAEDAAKKAAAKAAATGQKATVVVGKSSATAYPKGQGPDRTGQAIKTFIGKVWAAMGGKPPSDDGGGGGGGIRGYCAESDVCGATGKTWSQMSQQEKGMLCKGVRAEMDKVKGQGGDASASGCEGSIREPNWANIMGAKLDTLIQTTEDQGRKGDSKTGVLVPTNRGVHSDIVRTLPDPADPKSGGAIVDKPTPDPGAGGVSPR